ncbi:DUF3572 domain-containing protein [Sphingosinicella terrae]|uniref:DUF3572 domain-containing protein n=1 Tax=Sphingosinicella terrae TaxID=2172047 RepID=UPI000E0CF6C2|nr:DUF3572 domain-containing protein [Sphingosinicella terrae]
MRDEQTNDPEAAALQALGWTLSDDGRADRFLALTGLTPEQLRGRIGERSLLAALIRFLEAHEPDLVACAAFIGITPLQLVDVRRRLET